MTKSQLNTTTPIKTEYTYVNIGSDTTTVLDTEVSNVFAYSYYYDSNGNITAIRNGTEQSDGSYSYNNSTGNAYTYDQYNQLIRDLDNDNATSTHYEYDTNGNITKRIINSWDVEGNYPIKNLVTDYFTYSDSSWGDLLTSYTESGSKTAVTYNITYDAIGNPLNYRDGMTMTWVNGRELASLSKDGKTLNFTYDPDGLRTKKSITSSTGSTTNVEYVYEDGLLRQMTYGSYVLDFSYDANGTPVAFHVDNGGTVDKYYYYGVNSRGDVEALYNADGTLHAKYEYDAYGKLMSVKASDGTDIAATYAIAVLNPLRYRSYVYDTETGLYYLQSRYYDPTTCRFINADIFYETGQGITGYNMFAYCNNNPVSSYDPTGNRYVECCPQKNCVHTKTKPVVGTATVSAGDYSALEVSTIFGGYETGSMGSNIISGDFEQPVTFYAQTANEFWKINEYQVGMAINTEVNSLSVSVGSGGFYYSLAWDNSYFEFMLAGDKTGFTYANQVDIESCEIGPYTHMYIRPWTVVPVAIAAYYTGGAAIGVVASAVSVLDRVYS